MAKSNTAGIAHTHVAIAHSGIATHGEVSRASTRPKRPPPGATASSALRERPSGSSGRRSPSTSSAGAMSESSTCWAMCAESRYPSPIASSGEHSATATTARPAAYGTQWPAPTAQSARRRDGRRARKAPPRAPARRAGAARRSTSPSRARRSSCCPQRPSYAASGGSCAASYRSLPRGRASTRFVRGRRGASPRIAASSLSSCAPLVPPSTRSRGSRSGSPAGRAQPGTTVVEPR